MRHLFFNLTEYKEAFETLERAGMVNLDDEPSYWRILNIIDYLYKRYYVL